MEIRQLKYFAALAKYQNFTKAAQELYISQPTLSQQISALETSLGCQSFLSFQKNGGFNCCRRSSASKSRTIN